MPPSKKNENLQADEIVQAVVIADSFDNKFGPLTTAKPRCLMNLGDRPILSYTLDLLKISGVQECFVFCTSFASQIKAYLQEWAKDQGSNVMTINPIVNEDCISFGDAMRDLDGHGVLRQDFILCFGDCVGNVDLSSILQEHKAKVKEDRNAIMTLVHRKVSPGHYLRTVDNETFMAITESNKVLHYSRPGLEQNFKLPVEVFEDNEVNLKFDLMDVGITICTQAVPPLFSDNFDYQTLDGFVIGSIQDDLTDHSLYLREMDNDCYAARITNFHTYFGTQNDLLHRWIYPIVPEFASGKTPAGLGYSRHNIYKGTSIDLKKGSNLEQDVLVASGSTVGENSTIYESVIGKNSKIGNNVSVRSCIIGSNVVIEDGCQLIGCAIGNNVKISKNIVIDERCVLGDEVELKDNVTRLPKETWLVSKKPDSGFSDDEGDEDEEQSYGPKAILFRYENDDDDDSDEEIETITNKWGQAYNQNQFADEDTEDEDSDDEFGHLEDAVHNIEIDEDYKLKVFQTEVFESLQRGAKEGVKVDNLILEVNSSRHAYAVTPSQVIHCVLAAVLELASGQTESSNPSKLLAEVKKFLKDFREILAKYVKSPSAQADCLTALENYVHQEESFLPITAKIIQLLYNFDILHDESIFKWFKQLQNDDSIKEKVKPLIEWLAEEDETSSEEDD